MTGNSARTFAIVGICASFVLAGAAARTLDPVRPKLLDDEEGIRVELPGGEVIW